VNTITYLANSSVPGLVIICFLLALRCKRRWPVESRSRSFVLHTTGLQTTNLDHARQPATRRTARDPGGQIDPCRWAQTRLTPAPVDSPGARTYSYQSQDAPRSGTRPATPRPAHNSVPAASAIDWPPTPPPPTERPKKLAYAFSSNAATSNGDPVC